MTLPGPDIQILDTAASPGSLIDTGTAFMAGLSDRGPTVGQLAPADAVTSLNDFVSKYGARVSYSGLYDAVEAFFNEGGSRVFVGRFAGPAAAAASAAIPASSTKFTATAKSVGTWGNNLTVAVASGVISIYESGTLVEQSPAQADVVSAQAWSTTSRYINVTPVGTGALTDTAALALSGGAIDPTNVTDAQRQGALDRFGKDLGPGQVSIPGDVRIQAYTMLAAHAASRNRFAYLDAPDTSVASTITALAASVRALGREQARHCQLLAPWVNVPAAIPGQTKAVPPSAIQSGMAARSDEAGNPNRAVAGANGVSRWAFSLRAVFNDADRELLANAGVTVILTNPATGEIQTYDDVTPIDPTIDPEWLGAAGNRLVMAVVSDALAIAQAHMFGQVSGSVDLDAFGGDLKGMLSGYLQQRALFGGTPDEAYRVETGPTVNTTATIAARRLIAALALKISPNARQVTVQITNTPLTEAL